MKFDHLKQRLEKWGVYLFFRIHRKNKIYYKIAKTQEEKDRIYKFRYKIYIEELGRLLPEDFIDEKLKMVKDDVDDAPTTDQFYQEKNNEIIAAVRMAKFYPNAIPPRIKDMYFLRDYDWADNYTWSDISFAVVKQSLRSKLFFANFILSVAISQVKAVDFFIATCKPYLLHKYSLLGCILYGKQVTSIPDGIQIPIVWIVDEKATQKIFSPFEVIAPKTPKILEKHVNDLIETQTVGVLNPDKILHEITELKNQNPAVPFLNNHTLEYLIDYNCYLLHITDPVKIIHNHMKDKTMYLLLKGQATVHLKNIEITLEAGSLIGEFSYFERSKGEGQHEVDVICDHGTLLVINKSALNKLKNKHPDQYIDFMHLAMKSMLDKTFLMGNQTNPQLLLK